MFPHVPLLFVLQSTVSIYVVSNCLSSRYRNLIIAFIGPIKAVSGCWNAVILCIAIYSPSSQRTTLNRAHLQCGNNGARLQNCFIPLIDTNYRIVTDWVLVFATIAVRHSASRRKSVSRFSTFCSMRERRTSLGVCRSCNLSPPKFHSTTPTKSG